MINGGRKIVLTPFPSKKKAGPDFHPTARLSTWVYSYFLVFDSSSFSRLSSPPSSSC
jgi:hypothetical protein